MRCAAERATSSRRLTYHFRCHSQTMKHQSLIQETVSQLSSRFQPKVADVKKAIDQLIDKDYIERVEGTRDQYSYL